MRDVSTIALFVVFVVVAKLARRHCQSQDVQFPPPHPPPFTAFQFSINDARIQRLCQLPNKAAKVDDSALPFFLSWLLDVHSNETAEPV